MSWASIRPRVWRQAGVFLAGAAILTFPGCGTSATPAVSQPARHGEVATVNGAVPPGTPAKVVSSDLLLDTTDPDGQRTVVYRDTRAVGTRTPIHLHPHGGHTCVLQGQMTLYLEGAAPEARVAGQCYAMPADRPMAGVNSGDVDAVFLDSFTMPPGADVWEVVEPGTAELADQFGRGAAPS